MATLSITSTLRRPRLSALLEAALRFDARFRETRRLRDLDAERLDDIGLTRSQAEAETRARWDAPQHWHR